MKEYSFDEYLNEKMDDQLFKKEWKESECLFMVAQALIEARNSAGITQGELSDRSGVSRGVICRLERGNGNPSIKTLKRLAAGMGKTLKIEFVDSDFETHIRTERSEWKMKNTADRNVSIIKDTEGNNIVLINDIIFRGKRDISWNDVETYLKDHVGEFYKISETDDIVYFGKDLPDEYAHSDYTRSLKGTKAKAKANASQGLGEMIEIVHKGQYTANKKEKHRID